MFNENTENSEETDNATRAYDSHLLMGHFTELNEFPADIFNKTIALAEQALAESKSKKGIEKTLSQIESLKLYASSLAAKDKCIIEDIEGLFSFICVRHPNIDLDWRMLQKIILTSINKTVDYQDQKTIDLATSIYTSAIKKELNNT